MKIYDSTTYVHPNKEGHTQWYQLEVINMWEFAPSICTRKAGDHIIMFKLTNCYRKEGSDSYSCIIVRELTQEMKEELVKNGYTLTDSQ